MKYQQSSGLQLAGALGLISSIAIYGFSGMPVISLDFIVFLVVYLVASFILVMLLPSILILSAASLYKALNRKVNDLLLEMKINELNGSKLYLTAVGVYTVAMSIIIAFAYVSIVR